MTHTSALRQCHTTTTAEPIIMLTTLNTITKPLKNENLRNLQQQRTSPLAPQES